MIAVQKSQTAAVKALCQEFKCDKNAQDRVRMHSFFMHECTAHSYCIAYIHAFSDLERCREKSYSNAHNVHNRINQHKSTWLTRKDEYSHMCVYIVEASFRNVIACTAEE